MNNDIKRGGLVAASNRGAIMKNAKSIVTVLLGLALVSFSTLSMGEEVKRKWMPSACYKFRLDVMDKYGGPAWNSRYVIASSKGRVFVAERNGDGESNNEVFFPDDFHDANAPGINASVDCFWGDTYTWKIYVNGELRDSGTIGFHRNKPRY